MLLRVKLAVAATFHAGHLHGSYLGLSVIVHLCTMHWRGTSLNCYSIVPQSSIHQSIQITHTRPGNGPYEDENDRVYRTRSLSKP